MLHVRRHDERYERQSKDTVKAIKDKFDLDWQQTVVLRFRETPHYRFYLGPEPPRHPDFYEDGADRNETSVGSAASVLFNEDDSDVLVASSPAPLDDGQP